MPGNIVFPWDGRDQQDLAEARHNSSSRVKNRQLEDENLRLKQILRKNGIPWSAAVFHRTDHFGPQAKVGKPDATQAVSSAPQVTRRTRSSIAAAKDVIKNKLPYLPTEVLLRVLHYALTSPDPIIDPLSASKPENMTVVERGRGNKIAIGILATCKAFHAEGQRVLWGSNSFIFTSAESLRNFADLDLSFRQGMTDINLRIIARFYDDEDRKHKLDKAYHPSLKKDLPLKVAQRPKEQNLARKGFRCYTWTQVIDFLDALRAPFDSKHDKTLPRPRLLPNLETMRIDFVNFPEYFLPFSDTDLHEMAAHELGCTLNELAVTGLPCCEVGMKAGSDLSGMIKDGGLFLDGNPSYVQMKNSVKKLDGYQYCAKIIRAWRKNQPAGPSRNQNAGNNDSSSQSAANHDHAEHGHHHHHHADLPAAPDEEGHPISAWPKRKTIWKKVPKARDSDEREWKEFDRNSGYPVEDLMTLWGEDSDEDEGSVVCSKCGEVHGPFDLDDDDDLDDF